MKIPQPVLERLCLLYNFTENFGSLEKTNITSSEISSYLGFPAHTIRKDLSFLTGIESTGNGYKIDSLRYVIENTLGLDKKRKACIVGLGRLGTAILNFPDFLPKGIEIAAGFESNINRLEMIDSNIPLYPAYDIPEITAQFNIELAVLTVPSEALQKSVDRLVQGNIKGIINFSPGSFNVPDHIKIRNLYLIEEFQIISALLETEESNRS